MDGSGKDENFMLLGKHSLSNEPDSRVLASASSFRSESSPIGPRSSVLGSTQFHSLHHGDIALNIDHSAEKNPPFEEAKSTPCLKENCADQERNGATSKLSDPKANFRSLLYSFTEVKSPDGKFVQYWNRCFVMVCLIAMAVDPLFFFLKSTQPTNKCIVFNLTMATVLVIFRSICDSGYLLNIVLQFGVSYNNPKTREFGIGDIVNDRWKILQHNLSTPIFYLDLFNVLPIPQILVKVVIPLLGNSSDAKTASNFLSTGILVQYIPRLIRFVPLLAGQSPSGFIYTTAWGNFIVNLLTYVVAAHVVGSCWYLFGIQRVNQCFRDACTNSDLNSSACIRSINCGDKLWKHSEKARDIYNYTMIYSSCFDKEPSFDFGIYRLAVNLSTKHSPATRYAYSFFWGLQQLSTMAGNQVPSDYIWEVLFTAAITGLSLLLFALLIGNMQNFLQALGERRLKMTLTRRDHTRWMKNRRIPKKLRRQIYKAELHNWVATRGIDGEMLLNNLPEDLQRDVRHHLCKIIKDNKIFCGVNNVMLDSIFQMLKAQSYMKGSKILNQGSLVEKVVFIVHGEMESIGEDGSKVKLSKGGICGEELLTHYLHHSPEMTDAKKSNMRKPQLRSNRSVKCLTHAEAYTLKAEDIEEVVARFSHHQDVPGGTMYRPSQASEQDKSH